MLIAIDNGNRLVKGIHVEPFISGLTESEVQPFGKDVLKYRGKYYQLSDQRIPYHRDKSEDPRFFVLTLFGIAKEIEALGAYTSDFTHIQLAVGLPPAHYGAQYESFTRFFTGRGAISFTYQDKPYAICIDDVACFPQSYAAAGTIRPALTSIPMALIRDIGGMTADYWRIKTGEGDLPVCDSMENGVIMLYKKIIARVRAEQDLLLSEEAIDAILLERPSHGLDSVAPLVRQMAKEFVADLLSAMRERQLELRAWPVVFAGGGSILLRKQIEASGKVARPLFVDDIRANARGYELLYKLSKHSG